MKKLTALGRLRTTGINFTSACYCTVCHHTYVTVLTLLCHQSSYKIQVVSSYKNANLGSHDNTKMQSILDLESQGSSMGHMPATTYFLLMKEKLG